MTIPADTHHTAIAAYLDARRFRELLEAATQDVGSDDPVALCSDPAVLPLVDLAFERPGSETARYMADTLCRRCPVAGQCLDWAMSQREWGVWGGTTPKTRTQHGAPGAAAPLAEQRRAS